MFYVTILDSVKSTQYTDNMFYYMITILGLPSDEPCRATIASDDETERDGEYRPRTSGAWIPENETNNGALVDLAGHISESNDFVDIEGGMITATTPILTITTGLWSHLIDFDGSANYGTSGRGRAGFGEKILDIVQDALKYFMKEELLVEAWEFLKRVRAKIRPGVAANNPGLFALEKVMFHLSIWEGVIKGK
jgi:hypothetical protein